MRFTPVAQGLPACPVLAPGELLLTAPGANECWPSCEGLRWLGGCAHYAHDVSVAGGALAAHAAAPISTLGCALQAPYHVTQQFAL